MLPLCFTAEDAEDADEKLGCCRPQNNYHQADKSICWLAVVINLCVLRVLCG